MDSAPVASTVYAAGFTMDAGADKLARDGIIWTHLAGDLVQRRKVASRLVK